MSFRTRLFLSLSLAALVPLGLLALGVRREMTRRLTDDSDRRAGRATAALGDRLRRESEAVASRLAGIRSDLADDNRVRLALAEADREGRRGLLDLAGPAMRAAGLDFLELQDDAGRIVSSGHFRNDFDRVDSLLPMALRAAGTAPMLVRARTPSGAIEVLARLDSIRLAGRIYPIAGGIAVEPQLQAELARDPDLSLRIHHPGDSPQRLDDSLRVVAELPVPFVDLTSGAAAGPDTARLVVAQSGATLSALHRSVDRWFAVALAVAVPLALLTAAWLASRISRPLTELAERTAGIDFDRLEPRFVTDRDDEIGALTVVLGELTERLRTGAARLREAERRMATGDLARQVNHDVKNGLVPIRNVLRHLSQVARDQPSELAAVYQERRGTLESSLEYLDTLARSYARLSPALQRGPCDVNAVVTEVVGATLAGAATLQTATDPAIPPITADPLALRRILENLIGNAVDSLAGRTGTITVGTELAGTAGARRVRLSVGDTGPGMSRPELDRAFDDFHTTKPDGTGLGLSIVRRLVLDLGGSLRLEAAPGEGTRAIVELPVDGAGAAVEGSGQG